jgi:hypothetical protein
VPFTISHAAAVLPLQRTGNSRLPLAALMIGSMSPDFAYFLPVVVNRASSHDLEGIFLFCLPVGLALWLLFTRLIERPTIALLPVAWRQRVPRSDTTLSVRGLALASLAVVLGALTHIGWDAFTHAGTPVTDAFPFFHATVLTAEGQPVRVYRVLQYLSSVLGLVALAWWAWNLRHAPLANRHAAEVHDSLTDRVRVVALLTVAIASAVSALVGYASNLHGPFEARMFHLLIGGMAGCGIAWLAVAIWVSLRRARN